MAEGDTARLYHRLTSYESEGWDWDVKVDDPLVLQDFVANDFATWPAPCKTYPDGLPVVGLPREWGAAATGLDLAALARILYLSAGVVRVVEREDRPTLLLRAAGSAGGRFPFELYVRPGARRRPLVRPGRPCAGAGRPARRRRGDDADRHRRPVADRLALLRARLPPHLLGRGHGARADARARRRPRPRLWTRSPTRR